MLPQPMTDKEVKRFNQGKCPECGSEHFRHGPTGGDAENIMCAGCKQEFWFGPPFSPEKLPRQASGQRDSLYSMETFLLKPEIDMASYGWVQPPWWHLTRTQKSLLSGAVVGVILGVILWWGLGMLRSHGYQVESPL